MKKLKTLSGIRENGTLDSRPAGADRGHCLTGPATMIRDQAGRAVRPSQGDGLASGAEKLLDSSEADRRLDELRRWYRAHSRCA